MSEATTTSSDSHACRVCCNCGHEHDMDDVESIVILDADGNVRQVNDASDVTPGQTVVCADEEACERRMARWPQPDHEIDWSDPPFDYSEPEGEPFYCEDFYGSSHHEEWED